MKIYKNVYFWKDIPKFTGNNYMFYTGNVYTKVSNNRSVLDNFDRNTDSLIKCECDNHNFKGLIQIKK